jgi:hypothetical protein
VQVRQAKLDSAVIARLPDQVSSAHDRSSLVARLSDDSGACSRRVSLIQATRFGADGTRRPLAIAKNAVGVWNRTQQLGILLIP